MGLSRPEYWSGLPCPPLSMGLSRPEHCSGLPFPPQAMGLSRPEHCSGLPFPPQAMGLSRPEHCSGLPFPPLSMGLSRPEHCSGLPFPPPGALPDPGIEAESPGATALQAGSLPLSHREVTACLRLPKQNENQIVLAVAIHAPDRVVGSLEGAVAGSWNLGIVEHLNRCRKSL